MSEAFEKFLRETCFQKPPKHCIDLARAAWKARGEVDAGVAKTFNPRGSWGSIIAKAIREQK